MRDKTIELHACTLIIVTCTGICRHLLLVQDTLRLQCAEAAPLLFTCCQSGTRPAAFSDPVHP